MKDKQQLYEGLLAEARRDPNIIGLVLFGSRGKGLETPHSDFDCCVVAKDEVVSEYQQKLDKLVEHSAEFDLWTLDIGSFSKRPSLEERYDFAHVSPQIDKTDGRLQRIIDENSRIPETEIHAFVNGRLDHYIDKVFRSIKCIRDERSLGGRLEAVGSVPAWLDAVFAVHNRRVRPYNSYLVWELDTYPLSGFPMTSVEILGMIARILENGDCRTQQQLMKVSEQFFRAIGYDRVFDDWGGKDKWAMTWKPTT